MTDDRDQQQLSFPERYGPWAVVAGGSDGTGAAFAEELAARGVDVVLVARRRAVLEELAARLPTRTRVVVQDLAESGAGQALAEAVADLDVGLLVFNAGADEQSRPFLEQSLPDLARLVQRNCATVLETTHRLGTRLVARGRGGLVLVSSAAAWAGGANIATYGATKAFQLSLAEALWAEWRSQGTDVLALVLGATDTPSLRRLLAARGGAFPSLDQPAEVVRAALDHLADGPVWTVGSADPTGGNPFGAMPRREAVELMSSLSAQVYGDAGR